jgi:PAS domain S-box-containing protein
MTSNGSDLTIFPALWADVGEETLRALGQHVGIWQWCFEDGALLWSEHLLRMLGMTGESFVPNVDTFFGTVHPDDAAKVQTALEAHLERGVRYRLDFRHRHADGHYICCRTEGVVLRDPDGTPRMMVGVTLDISEQMEAQEALRESEQRLAKLAASFEGAIFRYRMCADGSNIIDYMSDGAESIWGLTPADIVGDPAKVWATVHPDDIAGVEDAFAIGTQRLTRVNHRWRVILPDGKARWIECRCTPRRLPDGDTLWDGFVIDISESIAAREELRIKTEMLGQAQKMEAVGRIAGGIAHDFNNLLAIILGNAELLEDETLSESDSESVAAIVEACGKGADLTRRLLSFARQSRLQPEPVRIGAVVEGMLPLVRRVLPEDIGIDLAIDADAQATVHVDVGLLESALINIMLNARDAMPQGGTIRVRVSQGSQRPAGAFVTLEIADTGHGIPAELLARVTEPFVTSKGPEMGSGLGLAMVDGFVDQSGGRMEIESTEGVGTTVRLHIPVARDMVEGRGAQITAREGATAARVLLVEDEKPVRLTLARQLRRLGLEVDAVENGAEALAFLSARGQAVDALISDVVMPGQPGGLELAARFRRQFPEKPAILISGYSDEPDRNDPQDDPLMVRLTKPVRQETLSETLSTLLRRSGS